AAHGPGAPALALPGYLGDGDLLLAGREVRARREPQPAVALPGALIELHTAVIPVTGVDRPVAAGLAARDGIPDAPVADGGHVGAGLGAHPHHRLAGRCDHRIGDGQPAGLDTVDRRHGERHVLGARAARVLDHLAAAVHPRVLDPARRRLQRNP